MQRVRHAALLVSLALMPSACASIAADDAAPRPESAPWPAIPRHDAYSAPLEPIAWLAGGWAIERGRGSHQGRPVEDEWWTPPRGGVMLGTLMSWNAASGSRRVIRHLRIEARPDGLHLVSRLEGDPAVEYAARPGAGDVIEFDASVDAYPRHIRYERIGERTLHVHWEGLQRDELNGVERAREVFRCFTMQRIR